MNCSSFATSPKQSGDDVVAIHSLDDGSILFILADGASGSGDGRVAAELFVKSCVENIKAFDVSNNIISHAFEKADGLIQLANLFAETTGILLLIKDDKYRCASVGDSECWMSSPDSYISLTENQRRKPRIGVGSILPSVNNGLVTGTIVMGSDGLFMTFKSIGDIFLIADRESGDKAMAVGSDAKSRYNPLPDDLSVIVIAAS